MTLRNCLAPGLLTIAFISGALLNACQGVSPVLVAHLKDQLQTLELRQVKLVFLNRLPSGRVIPLVASSLRALRFNSAFTLDISSMPNEQPLEQTLPFIESGVHLLELELKKQQTALKVPIVVPKHKQLEILRVLVLLSFDESGNHIREIQVGYDQDANQEMDPEYPVYRSVNGQNYQIRYPDGKEEPWSSPVLGEVSAEVLAPETQEPLPPGTDKVQPYSGEPNRPLPPNREEVPVPIPLPPPPPPQPLPPA